MFKAPEEELESEQSLKEKARRLVSSDEWKEVMVSALAEKLDMIEANLAASHGANIEQMRMWQGQHAILTEIINHPLDLVIWAQDRRRRKSGG